MAESAEATLHEETNSFLEDELEALRSIYINETDVQKDNENTIVSIDLHPATADNHQEQYVKMTLKLTLKAGYPEVIPEIHIRNPRGLSDEQLSSISADLLSLAEDKKGSSMLFEIIEAAKDHLTVGNRPSEECAICLYGFHDDDVFTKTECYHYFHSHCLARFAKTSLKGKGDSEPQETPSEKELLCPVCRLPIDFADIEESYPPPLHADNEFSMSDTILETQKKMQDLYIKQVEKGGIIDLEAEKNKYLIEISHAPSVLDDETKSEDESSSKQCDEKIKSQPSSPPTGEHAKRGKGYHQNHFSNRPPYPRSNQRFGKYNDRRENYQYRDNRNNDGSRNYQRGGRNDYGRRYNNYNNGRGTGYDNRNKPRYGNTRKGNFHENELKSFRHERQDSYDDRQDQSFDENSASPENNKINKEEEIGSWAKEVELAGEPWVIEDPDAADDRSNLFENDKRNDRHGADAAEGRTNRYENDKRNDRHGADDADGRSNRYENDKRNDRHGADGRSNRFENNKRNDRYGVDDADGRSNRFDGYSNKDDKRNDKDGADGRSNRFGNEKRNDRHGADDADGRSNRFGNDRRNDRQGSDRRNVGYGGNRGNYQYSDRRDNRYDRRNTRYDNGGRYDRHGDSANGRYDRRHDRYDSRKSNDHYGSRNQSYAPGRNFKTDENKQNRYPSHDKSETKLDWAAEMEAKNDSTIENEDKSMPHEVAEEGSTKETSPGNEPNPNSGSSLKDDPSEDAEDIPEAKEDRKSFNHHSNGRHNFSDRNSGMRRQNDDRNYTKRYQRGNSNGDRYNNAYSKQSHYQPHRRQARPQHFRQHSNDMDDGEYVQDEAIPKSTEEPSAAKESSQLACDDDAAGEVSEKQHSRNYPARNDSGSSYRNYRDGKPGYGNRYNNGNRNYNESRPYRSNRNSHNDYSDRTSNSGKRFPPKKYPSSDSSSAQQAQNDADVNQETMPKETVVESDAVEKSSNKPNQVQPKEIESSVPTSNFLPPMSSVAPPPGFQKTRKIVYGLAAANPPPGFNRS